MPDIFAGIQIYAEIYPHEGGAYAIERSQVLACTTDKNIKAQAGTFEIILAPGGPNGPDVGPSWLDVITPMSFVMIGMRRGNFAGVTMLGVATNINESWDFSGKPVRRSISITGQDIGYFFTHFSWYALTFINGPAAAIGIQLGNESAGALQGIENANANGTTAGLGGFLTQGSPDQIGKAWYLDVMDGPQGILSRTWLQYGKNNSVLFSDAVTVKFEQFIEAIKILWSFTFVGAEETWWQKFNRIFPFPWYEFFVMTAPAGFYGQATTTSWTDVTGGQTFTMKGLPNNPAQIYVIARVNPLPVLKATGGNNTLTFNGIDTKGWDSLKTFPEDTRLLRTTEEFCEDEVRNFYVVNPQFMKSLLGQANDQVIPPMLGVAAAVDPASIHRYGFRPAYMETEWFADPTGQIAQQAAGGGAGGGQNVALTFNQIMADLTSRLASQYEPVSLMMKATRTGFLRPDIIPGNKFSYSPLKESSSSIAGQGNSSIWTFYVEGVRHEYRMGGPSLTTLTLGRGLPSDVYSGTSGGGLLEMLHKGVAQRLNGVYQSGLPSSSFQTETGLEGISLLPDQVQKVLADIAPIYSTAQRK